MKIVKAREFGRIEKKAVAEGASEKQFMEQAGQKVAALSQNMIALGHLNPKIMLLCGPGNNGGDAYVAGRILRQGGFHVHALACAPFEASSPLCQLQSRRFVECGGRIEYINEQNPISFCDAELLIDGILGTGFHGEVTGIIKALIEQANQSRLPILAVDIPSGVDGNSGRFSTAIQASATLCLGLPKSGCFIGKAWEKVGRIHVYNFGLETHTIDEAIEDYHLIDDTFIHDALPPIRRTRHKYQAGYVIGLGGSKGMSGAPLMASLSALRAGAGIVRLLHPEDMGAELAHAPYELVRQGYRMGDVEPLLKEMQRATALFIGCGLGQSEQALTLLKAVLTGVTKPCVIDADALNLIAAHDLSFPKETIITPHHGEMKRLLKETREPALPELLEKAADYAESRKITLILKGAPTFIFHPGSKPYLTARGDPGMATAGSGDVLTGIVAALLAQTQDPHKAAILAVELHAQAGERAAKQFSSYCMKACDIIDHLPAVFKSYA